MRGENPSKEAVRTEIGEQPLQAVCYQLSRFGQFDGSGMPKVQGTTTKLWGAMAVGSPSTAQIWNWKTNVAAGKQKFATAKAAVTAYVTEQRNNHANLPALTTAQEELAWFQMFDNNTNYWVPNDNRDGWDKAASTTPFPDDVAAVLGNVRSGNPPADW